MRRVTTTIHRFTLPMDRSMVSRLLLTYTQSGMIILEKTEDDLTDHGNVWSIELSQEETKLFAQGIAYFQIRALTTDGKALASDELSFRVKPVFNEEILT